MSKRFALTSLAVVAVGALLLLTPGWSPADHGCGYHGYWAGHCGHGHAYGHGWYAPGYHSRHHAGMVYPGMSGSGLCGATGGYPVAQSPAASSETGGTEESEVADGQTKARAYFDVLVPADAEIWIGGKKTQPTGGSARCFVSPALETGKEFTYDFRAKWRENGEEVEPPRARPSSAQAIGNGSTSPRPMPGPSRKTGTIPATRRRRPLTRESPSRRPLASGPGPCDPRSVTTASNCVG